jgi:hypothetical protein
MTVASVGPATAQTVTVNDARGDVLRYTMTFDETAEPTEPVGVAAPGVTNGDVVRTTIGHTAKRVAVRVKFADLKRTGEFRGDFLSLRTNEGVRREVSLMAGPGMWRGEVEMTRPNGRPVRCAVQHRINYDTNVVRMSFPRRCASAPRWVQVGLGSMWAGSDMETFYMDDAQLDGQVRDILVWSPRVRRG